MDVLLTGAHGRIGTALKRHLVDRDPYRFTYLDVREGDAPERTILADVREYDAIRPAFEGQDAVVHLALTDRIGSDHVDAGWGEVLVDELAAITNAYAAAVDAGVERFVFASTNQLTRLHAYDHPDPPADLVDETAPIRPDSQYSLAKAYGEAYGRFCTEAHGLRVYVLRLGWVQVGGADHPYAASEADVAAGRTERGSDQYEAKAASSVWLSGRDVAGAVACCLRDDAVTYDVFNLASDNEGSWFDVSKARDHLGYDPRDDVAEGGEPPADALPD